MRLDHVKFDIDAADGLSGTTWGFYLIDSKLVVDEYRTWTRASKRNKPKVGSHWSRLNRRESNIKQEDVPFTDEIGKLAMVNFLKMAEYNMTVGFQEPR